jgi:AmmeMemoRadiSam system protein B
MKFRLGLLLLLVASASFWFLHKGTSALSQSIVTRNQAPIPAQYEDKSLFLSAIKQIQNKPSDKIITGLTVPHHLLAKDLIAKAFDFASNGKYNQILLLSPDHFDLGDSDISTTERNFLTISGEVSTDYDAVRRLEKLLFVHEQDFFYREHGLQAELPFIKYFFPDAKVIILTFKESTPRDELEQTVTELKKILTPNSLVVQSTDFSHYLTPWQAEIHDGQTIKVLRQADPEELFALNQPSNLDSIAAQYVQMRLQNEFFGSKFYLLDHKNSQDYTKEKVESSTSYIVQAYLKNSSTSGGQNAVLLFVGDLMLSRAVGTAMERRNDYNFPFSKMGTFLSDADITFGNLEGPISDRGTEVGSIYPFRNDPKVVGGLKNAGFDILSIANNHIWDYGRDAFVDTLNYLKNSGIDFVGGGENFDDAHRGIIKEINGTKIIFLGYTDLLPRSASAGQNSAGVSYLDMDQMIKDVGSAKNKADIVITSFHWGQEYQTKHNARQEQVAKAAIDAGASLVIGHHPHVMQEVEKYKNGYIAYSLGNFVFDQNFSEVTRSGLILKVSLKDKKMSRVDQFSVKFTSAFQPQLSDIVDGYYHSNISCKRKPARQ